MQANREVRLIKFAPIMVAISSSANADPRGQFHISSCWFSLDITPGIANPARTARSGSSP
jgi:hypothetical protein